MSIKKKMIITWIITMLIVVSAFFIMYQIEKKEFDFMNRYDKITADTKEIERKWLIDKEKIPYNLNNAEKYVFEQTYLCLSPEMRVRRINNGESYTFTIKTNMSANGLIRDELEFEITKEEYEDLLTKKEKDSITINKTRYQFFLEGELLAIDIFENELDGLAYLEIEFANEEESNSFNEPSWVIKDVTSDKRYKNQSLAKYGIPENL